MGVKVYFSKEIPLDEIEKKTNLKVRKNNIGEIQIRDKDEKFLGFPNLAVLNSDIPATSFTDMTFYGGNEYDEIGKEICRGFQCSGQDEYSMMDQYYTSIYEENLLAETQSDELKDLEDEHI